jgi:FPC/CPF motif-containing protein YcgG
MSPLLEQVLAEVAQLDPQEQLQLVSYLVNRWQEQANLLLSKKISRKNLFGCMQGKIKIAEDFNAPLSDFDEYM